MVTFKRFFLSPIVIILCLAVLYSCNEQEETEIGAGFRYSEYGPDYDPGSEYWNTVGNEMASKFENAEPECIWIVGRLNKKGVKFNFPVNIEDSLITGSDLDENIEVFELFDQTGMKVWLQIEPGYASIEKQIKLMLDRYHKHKCIIGVGIDVEWNKSLSPDKGLAVSDQDAKKWLEIIQSYNPDYKLFLKHWLIEKMPPTQRKDIVFVDDSQQFKSLDEMIIEFEEWGDTFYPSKVGFQYGYPADKKWWGKYKDPAYTIGQACLNKIANTSSLFWVDFTVLEQFPPENEINKNSSEKIIGVKSYQLQEDYHSLFEQWNQIHVNTAFVSKELSKENEFRQLAREHNIKVFTILPIFYAPDAVKKDPSLYAETNTGKQAKDDWVEFVCPSNQEFRKKRINEILSFVKDVKPDGISIDFIRHFLYWESVKPEDASESIENGCYCDQCLRLFEKDYEVSIPDSVTADKQSVSKWLNTEKREEWVKFKTELISSMLIDVVTEVKKHQSNILVNFHAVPWREKDYDNAGITLAGQNLKKISNYTDYISPMCYSFMLYRDSDWIISVVKDLNRKAYNKVLPSIQVRESYRDEEYSDIQFRKDLNAALSNNSKGVVFWSWEHLAKEPGKIKIIKEIFDENI